EPREILLVFRNKELKKDKKCIKLGYLGAVSMAEKFRGPGLPKVKVILLDEFQSKKNWDYLPNEPVELEDIYESVGR
ncbi:DNA encapsidation protein, partial [Enterococcus faecalis]|nr:DNA encapsidation protein [Enterococcus faecalis]